MRLTRIKLLYILYTIYIINCVFSESQMSEFYLLNLIMGVVRYFIIFAIALLVATKSNLRFRQKMLMPLTILMVSILGNMVFVDGGAGILLLMVIIASFYVYEINAEKITKITIYSLLLGHIFIVLLSISGFLEDRVYSRYLGNEIGNFFAGTYSRHTYGFLVQNQMPLTLLIIYILRIIYKKNNMKLIEHIAFAILNFMFYFTFGSRVSFILLYLVEISFFAAKLITNKRKSQKAKKRNLLWISYPVCFCLSLFISFKYDASTYIWLYINNIFMNRFIMCQQAIKTIGIKLFGSGQSAISNLEVVGLQNATIDNGYINILIVRGIVIAVAFVVMWSWLTYQAERKKDFYLVFSLVVLAVLNLIDSHLTSYKMIPFFCMMAVQYKNLNKYKKRSLGEVYD